jgi:glycosyltransferase involved in cell wall biosynthesis
VGRLNIWNICFWNVDIRIKLLLSKILPPGAFRLVDVCVNGSYYGRMEYSAPFQQRISFTARDYWTRLDRLVLKNAGASRPDARMRRRQFTIIPDGVLAPSAGEPAFQLLPRNVNPNLVIGTCCPITPGRRIEFLIEMMTELNRLSRETTLVIVGSLDPNRTDYWQMLLEILRSRKITNIFFAGPRADIIPVLKLLKVFLAVSEGPGFPPGCLEAMSLGVPVVATGARSVWACLFRRKRPFAIHANGPQTAAQYIHDILNDADLRHWFSKTAKATVLREFPMTRMLRSYQRLFADVPR